MSNYEVISCEVCTGDTEESKANGGCVCPTCPQCSFVGALRCYQLGHLVLTKEQEALINVQADSGG